MELKQKPRNPIERARDNPKSRSLALKGYFYDWVGCTLNPCSKDMRQEARELYKKARTEGLVKAVKRICFDCVGGDADPGPRLRVRDCSCGDCPLHPIRPWKAVKNRGASRNTPADRI
jgi:hypothetical protein